MIPWARENAGNRYILMVIDIFSRYGWARPLKRKTPGEVVNALKSVFVTSGRKPLMYLQTDQGEEFENKQVREFLQLHGIKQFSGKSQFKASIVERWNRTIKSKMFRYFTHVGKRRWLEVLPKLIKGYNASIHRSIGMAPRDVNKRNEFQLWKKQADADSKIKVDVRKLLHVGDYVRISLSKQLFTKGYDIQWTDEVFTITSVNTRPGSPVTYSLRDYEGEAIEGVFYQQEVQRVSKPTVFRVERVLRTRRDAASGQISRLIKWVGYKQPTWTTADIVRHE